MKIKQFEIWIANLDPRVGTEAGKTRPVLIIQTDLLNSVQHPSTIICPITTNVKEDVKILRVHIEKGIANIEESSDVMIDQIRAIDNKRLLRKVGSLPENLIEKVKQNIQIIFDMYSF